MSAADDLRAGADYIREHGHARYSPQADNGSVCVMGGIALGIGARIEICYGRPARVSRSKYSRFHAALEVLSDYLNKMGVSRCSVVTWSDISFADDVITHMEKAAAWIEEQA